MWNSRAITAPFGLSVFGSAQTRVDPDHVSVLFQVSCLEETPKQAFHSTKTAVAQVQSFLTTSQISEFGLSQINLEHTESKVHRHEFIGYTASVKFNLILRDLTQLEHVLTGIIDAGANHIQSITFGTIHLKTIRQQMREMAVKEATLKAQTYCDAANAKLGKIIHIEDVNPGDVTQHTSSHFQRLEAQLDESTSAFNPSSILVRGAVLLGFELE